MKKVTLEANIGDRKGTYNYTYQWETEVDNSVSDTLIGLMQKGFGETLRDKFSTLATVKDADGNEVDATPEDKDKHTREALSRLKDGSYTFGGRGPTMSPEDKAMKEILKAAGVKWTKGMEVDDGVTAYTKALAAEQEKEYTEDMDEKVRAALVKLPAYKKAVEHYKTQGKPAAPISEGIQL